MKDWQKKSKSVTLRLGVKEAENLELIRQQMQSESSQLWHTVNNSEVIRRLINREALAVRKTKGYATH